MTEWWESLSLLAQMFFYIAVPATFILLVQVVLSIVSSSGGDSDGLDTEHGFDLHSNGIDFDGDGIADVIPESSGGVFGSESVPDGNDSGLHILSFRGIIAFFAIFGWTGIMMLENGTANWLSVIVASAAGFLAMIGIAYLMKLVMKLQSDGSQNIKYALGVSGSVYITVMPQRKEKGKVNILLQGVLVELDAVTDETEPLTFGTEIVVIGFSGGNTLVVKRK